MIKFIEADELEDNFYAISKSNNPTQWILQGNETLEEEVFNDNASNGNWDLYGASDRYFLKGEEQTSNYLLDNYSIRSGYDEWRYYENIYLGNWARDYYYETLDICRVGSYWYVLALGDTHSNIGTSIHRFSEDWSQHVQIDILFGDKIEWDGSRFITLVGKGFYDYGQTLDNNPEWIADPSILNGQSMMDFTWDGNYWWVLADDDLFSNDFILYKLYSNFTYAGESHVISDVCPLNYGKTLNWDGNYWWIGSIRPYGNEIYKIYKNWTYTGISYNLNPNGFIKTDDFFYVIYLDNPYVYKYFSNDSIVYNISKNFQGNGYAYVQTDESEEIGLISSVYNYYISLKKGDCFEIDFQTNSDSEIKLELVNNGLEVKELILNSGRIFLDEDVEFNQIRFSSLFKDQDYLKIFDIKCYNVSNIVHYAEFYVEPFQSYSIYLTPTTYNLKILEGEKIKIDENIIILSFEDFYYTYYSPVILINSPHSNELFGNNSPSFNIEIKNNNGIDKMWYTLDNGLTNTTFTTNGTINQNLWDSLSNGTAIIVFYVKDSIGNIGTNSIIVRVDKVGPFIKINSPISNELFESTPPSFNVEISDANLDKIWYTINGEPKKYFFLSNGSLDSTVWSALPDGIVTIQFSANDTLGNIGFSEVAIRKDVNIPILVINNPDNNDVIGVLAPNFDLSIEEPHLDYTWYSLNGGNNITFTGLTGTIDQALWDDLSDGNIIIGFYANDSMGNIGFAEVTIRKDINVPVIAINNPQKSDVIGATAPNFDISIEEPNLDKTWYSLNGGNNITFTGLTGTIDQALWDALSDGNIIIGFYANDSAGNIGFQEVTVVKTISQPSPPGILGYNILFLLGIVSTIAIIIVKKRLNHLN